MLLDSARLSHLDCYWRLKINGFLVETLYFGVVGLGDGFCCKIRVDGLVLVKCIFISK